MLSGKARLAGIIGWPVGHSRSPRLHGFWLQKYGIDGAYVPLPVKPEHAAEVLRTLPKLGFAGCNVTVPHKEVAFRTMDATDSVASRLGAVNTVVVQADGSLHGSNTDGFGFIENLRDQVPNWSAAAGPAVVLGAGGSSRAVLGSLIDAGAPLIRLVNRTLERAQALAQAFGPTIEALPWAQRHAALEGATLVVNTTTQGMHNQPALDLDLRALAAPAVVADLVYVPMETPLLAAARARGLTAVDGLGLLLHQARPGFERWFGVRPEVTPELRAFVMADL